MPAVEVPRPLVVAGLAAVLLAIVGLVVFTFQRRLIYFPSGRPPAVEQVLPGASAVTFPTADGLELSAWYLPAGPVGAVVLPGNAGNRAARAPLAEALADLGLSVLLVDYRGYGGNPGRPTERGLHLDAEAAVAWLVGRPGIEDLVYVGESIGAAVAVGIAVEQPPAALVLRSPFTSLADVARVHYGPVPDWLVRERFPSLERVGSVTAPVLVVAGDHDEIVPIGQSRRVYEAAAGQKRFVVIPGARHNDAALLDGDRFIDGLGAFLGDHGLRG